MNHNLELVLKWQRLFGEGGRHVVSETPKVIEHDLAITRALFLDEETLEYLKANQEGDLVKVLDALLDLQYFLFGQVVIHGLQHIFDEAFQIVHDSNMSKAGEDGKPILREDGKILKGPEYWNPTEKLTQLLENSESLPSFSDTFLHG